MVRRPVGVGHKRRIDEVRDTMVYVQILKTLATLLKTDCVAGQVGKTSTLVCMHASSDHGFLQRVKGEYK